MGGWKSPALYAALGGCAVLAGRALMPHPLVLSALVAATLFAAETARDSGELIAQQRTFFGVHRVEQSASARRLLHGLTLHGAKWCGNDGSVESRTTYYAEGGPFAQLIEAAHGVNNAITIAIAGLGTGSFACYARGGDTVRIYEVDPAVVENARTHFAALRTCAPDAETVIGDALLALEAETGWPSASLLLYRLPELFR